MFFRRFSLFTYLVLVIMLGSSFVLAFVILCNRQLICNVLFDSQEEKYSAVTNAAAEEIDLYIQSVEESVHQTILHFQEDSQTLDKAKLLLTQTLKSRPSIFGMEIIYVRDHGLVAGETDFQAVYAWRDKTDEKEKYSLILRDYKMDYKSDWFTLPVIAKQAIWCEPYYDPAINVLMVTYSVPLLNEKNEVEAVFTADLSLDWLQNLLEKLPLGRTGEPIFFTADKEVYLRFHGNWMRQESIKELSKSEANEDKRKVYTDFANIMEKTNMGCIRFRQAYDDDHSWLYFCRMVRTGWTIGCVLPEEQVMGKVAHVSTLTLLFGLFGVLLLVLPSWWIARSVARPLNRLSTAAEDIAKGNFNGHLPKVPGHGEISKLVNSFDVMRIDLKRYIEEVTESTRIKERLSAELGVAHSIQLGMVPKTFTSTEEYGIDLYALMEPAQEVGGDLYDFAMLDEDNFYFCLGDVSGKGIPASLFMAVGKTLLKSTVKGVRDPASALTLVNDELMQYNDAALFITLFCGIYNLRTKQLVYANAGHCLPILQKSSGSDFLQVEPEFPLALVPNIQYKNGTITLEKGMGLFLYSDGATDAVNMEGKYFGDKQLLSTFTQLSSQKSESLVKNIMKNIHCFAGGAKQSDDITLLFFRLE